jgi:hypothetical protein
LTNLHAEDVTFYHLDQEWWEALAVVSIVRGIEHHSTLSEHQQMTDKQECTETRTLLQTQQPNKFQQQAILHVVQERSMESANSFEKKTSV